MTDISVFGDLTALFNARSTLRKSINYQLLDSNLKKELGVKEWDINLWFTLFNETNEGQVAFLDSLENIGWNIEKESSKNVKPIGRPTDHRFVSEISYHIGLSVGAADEVLIISDSFELYGAIKELNKSADEIKVSLAFFSDGLDNRWWQVLNSKNNIINFIDLNTILYDN
jgi:hypothetical protein